MDRKSDEPLSRAIMRAIGWCDSEGGHGTGEHMVSTETLMAWAADAVLLAREPDGLAEMTGGGVHVRQR